MTLFLGMCSETQNWKFKLRSYLQAAIVVMIAGSSVGCVRESSGTWDGYVVHKPMWDASNHEYSALAIQVTEGPAMRPKFKPAAGKPDLPKPEAVLTNRKGVVLSAELFKVGTAIKVTGQMAQFQDITIDGKTIVSDRRKDDKLDEPGLSIRVSSKIVPAGAR
jgi:hypothetical protein